MKKFLLLCGAISPLIYIGMTILGAALIPGYSHIKDTVSELMSPGAPNKTLMDILMASSSVFMSLFGIGVLYFVRGSGQASKLGLTSAILLIALGILQIVVVAFFPQDPMGQELTFPGKMHIGLVGVQALMSILIPLFLGLWLRKSGLMPGLGTYSIISAALTVAMGIAIMPLGNAILGLTERLTILIYDLWLIVMAMKMYFWKI
jgi:Protein of unknown function (DUF998)